MRYEDFIFLDVPGNISHALRVIPPTDRYAKIALVQCRTEVEFLRSEGFIRPTSAAFNAPIEEVVLRLSDLTEEGQDFVKSKALSSWLDACSRKHNEMLRKGASESERLAAYADPKGLITRLAKFRKQRTDNAL
jgi:hypothetical protein